ncbi:MAG: D-inositol-3-phosphate glycosyltransferase [Candidatus Omnitrophica bacterium]|nr:D-inositol-3-phosphate glycosyltransferase [Candidatus Omnitrophota bacterium]
MRILQVTPTYEPAYRFGGPIRSVAGLCRALARRGHEVQVHTTSSDGALDLDVPVGTPVMRDGVRVIYHRCGVLRRLYHAPGLARALCSEKDRWDVVHTHSVFLWPTLYAAHWARRNRVPYVVSPRGMLELELIRGKSRWLKTAWIGLFERRNLMSASAVHVTSQHEAEELGRFGWDLKRLWIVPNGIDPMTPPDIGTLGRFKAERSLTRPYVLYLGRIHPKKGIDRLMGAMALVPGAELVIAGNDEEGYRAKLERHVDQLGISARVRWVGAVEGEEKACWLGGAAVVALFSASENFGNSVLEAMAAGRPVAVTPGVGLASDIERSGCGLVLDGGPRALAAGLEGLLRDPQLAEGYGRLGARLASDIFSWDAVASQMERLYGGLIGARA